MVRSRYPRVFGSAAGKAQSRASMIAAGGFLPVIGAALGGLIESNVVTLREIGAAVPLTISGGSYSKNGAAYSTAATTISDGDTLQVRVTAPNTNDASASATISINGNARTFSVTTVAAVIVTPTPTPSAPTIAFANTTASVIEGNSGTKTVSNLINVTRNGVTGPLTVNLSYSGTATSGTDYVAGPVSGTIADGQTSLSFDLTINGDTGVESDETIVINAVLATYTSATASKTITVTNDDVAATPLTILTYGSSTPERWFTNGTGPVNDQVFYSTDGVNFTPGNGVGSGAATFGDLLQKAFNRPIRLLRKAQSGTKLSEWEAAGSPYRSSAVAAAKAAGAIDLGISIVGFNDAYQDAGVSVAADQAGQNAILRSLLSKLRAEIGLGSFPVMIGGTQRYTGTNASGPDEAYTKVRTAELVVAADANNFFGGHSLDLDQVSDGIHQNENTSTPIHATRLATSAIAFLKGLPVAVGPKVSSVVARYRTQTDVKLTHSGTATDFTPTTGLTGFIISVDSFATSLAITAAIRVDATTVRLTHADAGGIAPAVMLMTGRQPSIAGLLKDNSALALPVNPTASVSTSAAGSTVVDPALSAPATDTFTGADGATLQSHVSDTGQAWTSRSGTLLIGANRIYPSASGSYTLAYTPAVNCYAKADITYVGAAGNRSAGLLLRAKGSSDAVYAYYTTTTGGTGWFIATVVGGVLGTPVAVASAPAFAVGQTHKAELRCVGDTATLLVDNVAYGSLTLTDAALLTAGEVGIRTANTASTTTGFHYDNYEAGTLSA
jgi:hypothetical protein